MYTLMQDANNKENWGEGLDREAYGNFTISVNIFC